MRYPLFLISFVLLAHSAPAAQLPLGGGEVFVYQAPKGMKHELKERPTPRIPITARVSSRSVALMMTPIRYDKSRIKDLKDLDRLLAGASRRALAGSVEKKVNLKRLKNHRSNYSTFTDASLVGKKVTPGNFKYATIGFVMGKNYLINFTLLSNSVESELTDTLKILEGASFAKDL